MPLPEIGDVAIVENRCDQYMSDCRDEKERNRQIRQLDRPDRLHNGYELLAFSVEIKTRRGDRPLPRGTQIEHYRALEEV